MVAGGDYDKEYRMDSIMSSVVGDSKSMSVCAACGKSGDNLKACTACKLVKYCNRECQISHRPKHKKECRKRAAELRCAGDDKTSNSNVNEISEGIGNVGLSGSVSGSSTDKKTSTSCEQNNYGDVSISDEELFQDPPPKEECQICYLPMPFSNGVCGISKIYMTCCGKVFCSGCVVAESQEMKEGKMKPLCAFCREPIGVSKKVHIDRVKKRIGMKDALACHRLGQAYSNGEWGLPRNSKKAFELYVQAVKNGVTEGYISISSAYQSGEGVGKDLAKAMYYCKLAAIGGHEIARNNLGSTVSRQGNNIRAMKHFKIAARAGFDHSMKVIGQGYKHGYVTKNEYANTLRTYQVSVDEMKSKERTQSACVPEYKHTLLVRPNK